MNLVIDIGNSNTKAAVFDGHQLVEHWCWVSMSAELLETVLEKYPAVKRTILSSSGDEPFAVDRTLAGKVETFIRFSPLMRTPLKNSYGTPFTLGPDRLAAAIGAHQLYPNRNLVVVDFGTAMTVDAVTAEGEYLGGNISPGARTRFRALSDYTSKLPLGQLPEADGKEYNLLTGKNTEQAIEAGVVNGIIFELQGYMERYGAILVNPAFIFTGGEGKYFAEKVKNTIFANYDLVLTGLNTILEYNANQK